MSKIIGAKAASRPTIPWCPGSFSASLLPSKNSRQEAAIRMQPAESSTRSGQTAGEPLAPAASIDKVCFWQKRFYQFLSFPVDGGK